jgi:hypothetical protein
MALSRIVTNFGGRNYRDVVRRNGLRPEATDRGGRAGVFYLEENRERTSESPTDKLRMSVTAVADESERGKGRQRTYDSMQRQAQSAHVTGGRRAIVDSSAHWRLIWCPRKRINIKHEGRSAYRARRRPACRVIGDRYTCRHG